LQRIGPVVDELVLGLPIDIPIAQRAGQIRAAHYSRGKTPISLADCLLLACAEENDEIATADSAVIRVARALNIGTIPLLDSQGRRPG
jgi:predicted nucleic acid-binding protein